jgi:hypothetical protein
MIAIIDKCAVQVFRFEEDDTVIEHGIRMEGPGKEMFLRNL